MFIIIIRISVILIASLSVQAHEKVNVDNILQGLCTPQLSRL